MDIGLFSNPFQSALIFGDWFSKYILVLLVSGALLCWLVRRANHRRPGSKTALVVSLVVIALFAFFGAKHQ